MPTAMQQMHGDDDGVRCVYLYMCYYNVQGHNTEMLHLTSLPPSLIYSPTEEEHKNLCKQAKLKQMCMFG